MQIQWRQESRREARQRFLTTYSWSFQPADDGFDLHLHFTRKRNTRIIGVVLIAVFAVLLWKVIWIAAPGLQPLLSGRAPAGVEWMYLALGGFFLMAFVGGLAGPGRKGIVTALRGSRIVRFRYQGHTAADCLLTTAPTELRIMSDAQGTELRAVQSGLVVEIARFGGPYPAQRLAADLKVRCPSFSLQACE